MNRAIYLVEFPLVLGAIKPTKVVMGTQNQTSITYARFNTYIYGCSI